MAKNPNPIANFLSGLITPDELAAATKLSKATCKHVIDNPYHVFNAETVLIIHHWFAKNFEPDNVRNPCKPEDLFNESNISDRGRLPQTGGNYVASKKKQELREIQCPNRGCNMMTPRAVKYCVHCDGPLV